MTAKCGSKSDCQSLFTNSENTPNPPPIKVYSKFRPNPLHKTIPGLYLHNTRHRAVIISLPTKVPSLKWLLRTLAQRTYAANQGLIHCMAQRTYAANQGLIHCMSNGLNIFNTTLDIVTPTSIRLTTVHCLYRVHPVFIIWQFALNLIPNFKSLQTISPFC